MKKERKKKKNKAYISSRPFPFGQTAIRKSTPRTPPVICPSPEIRLKQRLIACSASKAHELRADAFAIGGLAPYPPSDAPLAAFAHPS